MANAAPAFSTLIKTDASGNPTSHRSRFSAPSSRPACVSPASQRSVSRYYSPSFPSFFLSFLPSRYRGYPMSGGSRIYGPPSRGSRRKGFDVDGCQLARSWVGSFFGSSDWPTARRRTPPEEGERRGARVWCALNHLVRGRCDSDVFTFP
jgi:hypothetical protein